ncbi:MAG: isoprenylcysteine carboxylmethyltransferase family protein [Gammaproteobacteria bacterium]|nr:isoprenylcysteine carboxylmethyltransferase family protein [Gammaproteobacteria bacterium]
MRFPGTPSPDNSSGIIAPPPVLYIGAFLAGLAIHLVSPLSIFDATHAGRTVGAAFLVVSAVLARWAFVALRRAGTSANPYRPSAALTIAGPFRYSRNPIYLAMTGLYLGASLLVNSVWPLLLVVPLLWVMYLGVILREERYLSAKFGAAYAAYKSEVRRWL